MTVIVKGVSRDRSNVGVRVEMPIEIDGRVGGD